MRNKLTSILQYNLPNFVREEHEVFVAFVQAYYEFCEEEGNVLSFLQQFEDNQDVDQASDEYLEAFIAEMAVTFPKNLLIDKATLLKTIKEFYISKGSEQSFRFLFTILFNTKIEIQYPKVFMHKTSNGKYTSNDFATITANNDFKFDLSAELEDIAAEIEGVSSGATAIIDSFAMTYFEDQKIFLLDISSYRGAFTPNEEIYLRVNNTTVQERIYGTINTIAVNDGGTNYEIDDVVSITDATGQRARAKIKRLDHGAIDEITITNAGTGYAVGETFGAVALGPESPGYGFLGEILEVDTGGEILSTRVSNGGYDYSKPTVGNVKQGTGTGAVLTLNGANIGKIVSMEVYSQGIGYDDPDDVTVSIATDNGSGADFTVLVTGIFNEPKKYINADDWPSNYNRIQDSHYYQDFSYVIQSGISPHRWIEQIKRVNHPAGTKIFGSLAFNLEFDISIILAPRTDTTLKKIIKLFYGWEITNPVSFSDRELVLVLGDVSLTACTMDTTLKDLEFMKFQDTFTWTIEPFADYTIADVINPCQTLINQSEGATITIT